MLTGIQWGFWPMATSPLIFLVSLKLLPWQAKFVHSTSCEKWFAPLQLCVRSISQWFLHLHACDISDLTRPLRRISESASKLGSEIQPTKLRVPANVRHWNGICFAFCILNKRFVDYFPIFDAKTCSIVGFTNSTNPTNRAFARAIRRIIGRAR